MQNETNPLKSCGRV